MDEDAIEDALEDLAEAVAEVRLAEMLEADTSGPEAEVARMQRRLEAVKARQTRH